MKVTARITVHLPFRTTIEEGKTYPIIEKDLGNGGKVVIHPFEYIWPKNVIHTGYDNDHRKITMDIVLPCESDLSTDAAIKPFMEKADEYLRLFLSHCKTKSRQFWWYPISFGPHSISGFFYEVELIDESGHKIRAYKGTIGGPFVLDVGINEEIWESVKNDIAGDIPPSIVDFHLEEARYAAFAGSIEILIVNTAIALEIFTERFCNKYAKANGKEKDLANLLSNNSKDGFVIKYFKKIIPGLTSESLDCDSYQLIDYLFRTRNKIVHEGETSYKDVTGKAQPVNFDKASEFSSAAGEAMNWMRTIDRTIAEKIRCFCKIGYSSV